MIHIIFTFIISYLVLFVSWFLPKAGTSEYKDPTRKELIVLAILASVPALFASLLI